MGLDENLSKGFILNLLDVHKVELKPAFAHQNEIKLLENLAAEIKEVKGETPASKAEKRRIAAEAQKNLQIAKKNQSRAMRNVNAMAEKFMVFVGYTLREHYYWSRARVNHFFDNFCDVIARFNDHVDRDARENELDAIRIAKEFEEKHKIDVDTLFKEARDELDKFERGEE